MINEYDWNRLEGLGFDLNYIEKSTGELKDSCWKGYTAVGMKKKKGKRVPNCVPLTSKHVEENPLDEMTPKHLPELPKTKKSKPKEQFMTSSGFSEECKPNGGMLIAQLRSMQENIAVILSIVNPETNLDPWMASKITEAEHGMTAIADYLKYKRH